MLNESHKSIINEVVKKTDQAIIDRFDQIESEIAELEGEKKEIRAELEIKQINLEKEISELNAKIVTLQTSWNSLVNRVYYNPE